jgi:hypothetical protein
LGSGRRSRRPCGRALADLGSFTDATLPGLYYAQSVKACWLPAILLAIAVLCVAVYVFFGFMMGGGAGWHPDRHSVAATRVYAIDRQLRIGMRKTDVLSLLASGIAQQDHDSLQETDATFNGWERLCPSPSCSAKGGAGYFELMVFEPRRGLDGFDTHWMLRVRFDDRGRLAEHSVRPEICCGP